MKHTKGVWYFTESATPEYCRQYLVYSDADPHRNVALVYDSPEARANARLIATAPDLLEALQETYAELQYMARSGDSCAPKKLMDRINRALIEATMED